MSIRLLHGDCRAVLAELPADSVQCVVTSPPYYGLRDYGTGAWEGGDPACSHDAGPRASTASRLKGGRGQGDCERDCRMPIVGGTCFCGARRTDRQIGLEASPAEYVAELVAVMRQVRRVLRPDGTLWLNLGDSYASSPTGSLGSAMALDGGTATQTASLRRPDKSTYAKPKDLLMIPARVAIALQEDGWWLRADCIWHKLNPMPESVRDRPTSAHEHVFLLTKSERYFYDSATVAEPATYDGPPKPGKQAAITSTGGKVSMALGQAAATRNLRNVFSLASEPFAEAHFATMPPALAEICIKAGSRPGDTILDPFAGAGTTLLVADRLQRHGLGIELNPDYADLARQRVVSDAPLFAEVA